MKKLSNALKAHLAQPYQTMTTCWLVVRVDGGVFAFTDHDQDITFDCEAALTGLGIPVPPDMVGTGSQTYLAESGFTPSDIATSDALNVDNLELDGVLVSPSITETDLNAGLWDFAFILVFQVNWHDFLLTVGNVSVPVGQFTRAGAVATVSISPKVHGLKSGEQVEIFGANQIEYDGVHVITVTTTQHFTFPVIGTPATPATGTITYQALCGPLIERVGRLGEVTIERGAFKAEMRGIMQAYTRSIGELTSPTCRVKTLGDARCKIDLTPFTVTSTITGVNANLITLYDTARTEPGPTGGVAITNVTNANPGVFTVADATPLIENLSIIIDSIVGPVALNGAGQVHHLSGTHFDIGIDTTNTTNFPPYVSGGTVTPLGGNSGYFDYGLITFTSGLNIGLSMEVKNYAPGVIVLQLPMPYAVAPGDAYTMIAGCDRTLPTCRDRFANVVNFRGEPYLPGIDRVIQVGRHS